MSDASGSNPDLARETIDWPSHRRRLTVMLFGTIISGLIGQFYGSYFYDQIPGDAFRGFRTGAMIGGASIAVEVYYIRSLRNTWIRRVAFLPGLLVRMLVLTIFVRLALIANEFISDVLVGQPLMLDFDPKLEVRDTLFSMAVVVGFVIISQLASLVGIKRFFNLVIGRYFRPTQEDRQFLFIDLVDSTRLARDLGDLAFHEFLADFFHLIDRPIANEGGEIISYVGDAAIVTWPLTDKPARNARSLAALRQIELIVQRRSSTFVQRYGEVPRFRAALHGGTVVVGECGNTRRQVTFLGDVVNITARMESWAKEAGEHVVISDSLMEKMGKPEGARTEPLGEHIMRGSTDGVSLSRLQFS